MSPENTRRPIFEIVKDEIMKGTPRHEIPGKTKLETIQVRMSIQHLRKTNRIPQNAALYEPQTRMQEGWSNIYPLALRGGLPSEIEEITGIPRNKINKGMQVKRKVKPFQRSDFDKETIWRRRSRKSKRVARTRFGKESSGAEKNSIEFAKRLFEKKLILEQTAFWSLMESVSVKEGRDWMNSFAYGLIMEVFMIAKYQELRRNGKLMQLFGRIGTEVNPEWFNSKEFVQDRDLASREVSQAAFKSQRLNK